MSSISSNHRPVVHEAMVVPSPVTLEDPVSVHIHADDQDRDVLTFHHQWIVNGHAVVGQTTSTLPVDFLKRGDTVAVEIVPDDGKELGEKYRTDAVSVVNTPPVISSLSVHPESAKPGDKLTAIVEAADPDYDGFEMSFRWLKNGTVVKEGSEPVLDTTGLSSKDIVMVEVTPRDQTAVGKAVRSRSLVLANSPPVIMSTPSPPTNGKRYEYTVKAIDPEGDGIHFRLETAPPGMVITPDTGSIVWETKGDITGTHKVRVVAEDSHGGFAFQEFDVTLLDPASSKLGGA